VADFVVLASGSGTNFDAIAAYEPLAAHRLLALVTDNPDAVALRRAEQRGIASIVVHYGAGRRDAEARLCRVLDSLSPDLVVLAGFMKVLPAEIVDRFAGRIVNIHPSMLPAYPGLRAIERSYADQDSRMGVSIHLVDHGVDTGPLVEQHAAARDGTETLSEMEARIHALEHEHYPRVVAALLARVGRTATEAR